MPTSRTQSTATRGRSSTRAGSAARNEIIKMLKDDHKKVKKAFREFEKLDPHEDTERCQEIVAETCTDLEVHAALEEEVFYPAARECLNEEDLIDEAEVEHSTLKMLIGELKGMTPEDDKFVATFTVLSEYVKHHVGEEEGSMFPKLAHAKFNWEELAEQMTQRREELTAEYQSASTKTDGKLTTEGKSRGSKSNRSTPSRDGGATKDQGADEDME